MTTAVISDTHLFHHFNEKKFHYLKSIFERYDQVIINGDFWDGYICTFDKFINSEWNRLFPYMKNKTVYVYGNHDRKIWQDDRNLQFCIKAVNQYVHQLPDGRNLVIEHGNRYLDGFTEIITQYRIVAALSKPLYALASLEESIMTKLFGWRGTKLVVHSDRNKRTIMLSRAARESSRNGDIFVFSHTHYALLDLLNKHINTGAIRFGLSSYLKIDGNSMEIVSERY